MAVAATLDDDALQRSDESRAFEAFWRSLRRDAPVPRRSDFHPAGARHLLRNLVLLDAPRQGSEHALIRVSGEGYNQVAGVNMRGRDHLDLLPQQYRADAVATSEAMMATPCGLWQISPFHLARGYAVRVEMTAFPLRGEDGPDCFLGHVRATDGVTPVSLPTPLGVAIDTALVYRYLDIGAGIPG
ncbi:MAG: PAS domain-containing protein [Alphaproteobacteria bacterium]|nr:PAS domain-containing protein [Alphaproteobacteria bacterium]